MDQMVGLLAGLMTAKVITKPNYVYKMGKWIKTDPILKTQN